MIGVCLVMLRAFSRRCAMSTGAILTYDEHKASEAAFRGLPLDPKWSKQAQDVYRSILAVTKGRGIVAEEEISDLVTEV
jgi:hypothetical protein